MVKICQCIYSILQKIYRKVVHNLFQCIKCQRRGLSLRRFKVFPCVFPPLCSQCSLVCFPLARVCVCFCGCGLPSSLFWLQAFLILHTCLQPTHHLTRSAHLLFVSSCACSISTLFNYSLPGCCFNSDGSFATRLIQAWSTYTKDFILKQGFPLFGSQKHPVRISII